MAANPLSLFWYPFAWVSLLFPLPFGHNLMVALHILWGAMGMYYLLKAEGLSHRAGILGGLAFASMPKLFAHYGAGHLSFWFAITWTPWLLWFFRETQTPGRLSRSRFGAKSFPGIIFALIILADIRWAVYAGLLWFGYFIAHSHLWMQPPDTPETDYRKIQNRLRKIWQSIQLLIYQVVIGVSLGAPLIIPLLEYTRLSTRSSMVDDDVLIFSLPPAKLLGLMFPDFGGSHELMVYVGVVPLVLTVVWLFKQSKTTGERFWGCVGGISLVYALGANIPLMEYFVRLPGVSLLRVPARALFLMGMAAAALSAYGVDLLLKESAKVDIRKVSLSLTALSAVAIFLWGGVAFISQRISAEFTWGAAAILLVSLWVAGFLKGGIPQKSWYVILLGLALIDWGGINLSVLAFHPKGEVLNEKKEVVEFLAQQNGIFRTYSPSYSLSQQVAAFNGITITDGVDPLQLAAYADFMEAATGVPRPQYSVTIPSFSEGAPPTANKDFSPDPQQLGLLNVRYILSEFDQNMPGLALQAQFGETRIYENEYAYHRAWVQPVDAAIGDPIIPVESIILEPNRIAVSASGPGMLVLSEIAYPGWIVRVDGEPAPIKTFAQILRAVDIASGNHEIVFVYRPFSVYIGLAIFFFGVITVIFMDQRSRVKSQ